MSSEYNKRKRNEAIEYLKSRGKHLLSTSFTPTNAANTNVAKTFEEYKNDSNRVWTDVEPKGR
jgi:hypothetical protein